MRSPRTLRGPGLSDRATSVLRLQMDPGSRSVGDPELLRAQRLEREDALRALHALRVPLGLQIEIDRAGSMSVAFLAPRSGSRPLRSIWGPRLAPWSWASDGYDTWRARLRGHGPQAHVGVICGAVRDPSASPLRSARSEQHVSPWTLLLPALRGTGRPTTVRWLARPVGPSSPTALAPARRLPRSDRDTPLSTPTAHRMEREVEDLRGERGAGPFWACGGVLATSPAEGEARTTGLEEVGLAWDALSGLPGGGRLRVRWKHRAGPCRRLLESAERLEPPSDRLHPLGLGDGPALLSPAELLLWLPPWDARRTPGLRRAGSSPFSGVIVGRDEAGEKVPWPLSPDEGHHLVVTGETGMGKSTLLQGLGASLANLQSSLVVLDPLGDTAEGLLALLSDEVQSRALWVSPLVSPVGINALELPLGFSGLDARTERERRVSELVTALRRVRAERYGDTVFWGPRIEDLLTRALLLLSYGPGATLRDAAQLLSDPEGWAGPWPPGTGDAREVQVLWESLRREAPEERQGALRVVQEVALSSAISRVLAAPKPRWSLDRALLPGAVTFFALERTAIGVRASSYLGAALLSLLWSHLLARKQRTKVVLILDEVQEYANDALNEMLRLGRRYNLHVLSATQSLASLSEGLRDSLITNSRDLLFFRGSAGEARLVRDGLGVGREHDLATMPRGTALALFEKGVGTTVLRADPPRRALDPQASSRRALLACIERSRPFWAPEDDLAGDVSVGPPTEHPPSTPNPTNPPPRRARPERLADGPGTDVGAGPPSLPGAGAMEATSQGELDLPLMCLLIAALEAPEGEPFGVTLSQVRRVCGEDERTVRRLGACLKGAAALVRTERRQGERIWWLLREHLQSLVPAPWEPARLAKARDLWERVRPE